MKNNKDKKQLSPEEEKAMFSNLEFSYSKSKEEVWSRLEGLMGDEEEESATIERSMAPDVEEATKTRSINWRWMSVAASVVILLSAGLFARFYTKTVAVAPGEFLSHTLPDGSEVHLNAATSIAYKPYWWKFNRGVEMQGEAYFVVAKGEKFTVNAVMGSVEVLGTEFNVYARGDDFKVYCEEGRVKVTSEMLVESSQKAVILTQGHLAEMELNHLNNPVLLKRTQGVPTQSILSWRTGKFLFDSDPLEIVFADIERQYGVSILLKDDFIKRLHFSGAFARNMELEDVFKLLSVTMELDYDMIQEGVYQFSKKE